MKDNSNKLANEQAQNRFVKNCPISSCTSKVLDTTGLYIDPLFALSLDHKLFVMSCLTEHQRRNGDIKDIIDALDPEAEIDAGCCDLIEQICNEPQLHLFAILNFLAVDLVTDQLAAQEPSPIGSPRLCD